MPADDLTDPAPATTFAHLDATTVLSRAIAELGIYPAVDPLDSTLAHPRPADRRRRALRRRPRVQQILQRYKDLQDIIAILGMDELSEEDKLTVAARPQDPALPLAAVPRRRAVHRHARASTSSSRTRSSGFNMIFATASATTFRAGLPVRWRYRGSPREGRVNGRDGLGSIRWTRTLLAEIVTPERILYTNEVQMVVALNTDGEIGILPLHAPIVDDARPGRGAPSFRRRRGRLGVLLDLGRVPAGP